MSFAPVSETEMQAARLLTGAAMVGFLSASLFRRYSRDIRVATLVLYVAGIFAFITYHLW